MLVVLEYSLQMRRYFHHPLQPHNQQTKQTTEQNTNHQRQNNGISTIISHRPTTTTVPLFYHSLCRQRNIPQRTRLPDVSTKTCPLLLLMMVVLSPAWAVCMRTPATFSNQHRYTYTHFYNKQRENSGKTTVSHTSPTQQRNRCSVDTGAAAAVESRRRRRPSVRLGPRPIPQTVDSLATGHVTDLPVKIAVAGWRVTGEGGSEKSDGASSHVRPSLSHSPITYTD